MVMDNKNYTLGRGKVYFSRFKAGTQIPAGFFYIGNTPEFNLTIESEVLDHFSSDEGIREKDDSIPLQVNRTGSMITDNIAPRNVALFFFGDEELVTTTAQNDLVETIEGVKLGHFYRLGATPANPTGFFGLDAADITVTNGGGAPVTYTAGTDYLINADFGTIQILETGTIAADSDVEVTFSVRASTRERVLSGSTSVEGAMMYEAKNPKGKQFNYYMPFVKVSPNGDYALKSDEWQQIPFTLDIQKPNEGNAIYMDGAAVFA